MNIENQLKLLKKFDYQDEFLNFVENEKYKSSPEAFKINDASNGSFSAILVYMLI